MSARDHDLPILDELGAEFAAMVNAADDATRRPIRRRAPLPAPSARRDRGAQARRIGRRVAIVLVLICLVGGAAFAALRGGGGSGRAAHTAPTQLGRAADGAWTFSAYRDEGRLCTVFVPRGGELSGSCGTGPGDGEVRADSAIAAGHRYVFGLTGTGVARVAASLTKDGARHGARITADAKAEAPVDRGAARDAGFPGGDGWFVIDLGPDRGAPGNVPAILTPLDSGGRPAGPAYADCSLGMLAPACKRRIDAAASGN